MWSLICRLTYVLDCTYESDHGSCALQNTYNRKNLLVMNVRRTLIKEEFIQKQNFCSPINIICDVWCGFTYFLDYVDRKINKSRTSKFQDCFKRGKNSLFEILILWLETKIRTGDRNQFFWRWQFQKKAKEELSKSGSRKILKNHMKSIMIYTLNLAKPKRLLWSLENK